jgi:alpha-ribazole phosphatase
LELILVRHTRTVAPPGICYGQTDLLPASDDDMVKVAGQLRSYPSPTVFSSPLNRCRLLAEKISSQITFDDRLMELNFGNWEMKYWDDLRGPEVDEWMNDFVNVSCPKGESYAQMENRVLDFINSLKFTQPKNVIIVTHAGVIRILLAKFRKIPLKNSFDIQIDYGQIDRIPLSLL